VLITRDANLTFNYDDANDMITIGLGSLGGTDEMARKS
jgi:hypothetical protein